MDDIAKFKAVDALKTLKARYFYHLDVKDWPAWGEVFAPDAVMDMTAEFAHAPDPSAYVFRGRDEIVQRVSGALGSTITVHHGHMPILEFQSGDAATGIWAMEDNLFFADGKHMLGYGHYREQYRKIDGTWYIAHTTLARLWKAMDPFVTGTRGDQAAGA